MNKIKPLILVSILVTWAIMLTKCTSEPKDETKLVQDPEQRMAFGAAIVAPDSFKVTPSGDTNKYYHRTEQKTGTTTYITAYDVPYIITTAKGSITPPDTTTPPPIGGQIYPLSFTSLPIGDPDINRPWAGFEQWHDHNDIDLGYTPSDVYWRFVATRIATAQKGVYNWSYFDNLINQARAKGQKLSFGVMTVYPEGTTNEGLINIGTGTAAYPLWLQSAMSGEWQKGKTWVPNYNDPAYLAWCLEFNKAVNDHIYAIGAQNMINGIDIRHYGSWGEWHSANLVENVSEYPAGTFPTAASLKKIVDSYTQGYPTFQLSCMIAAFDAQWLRNTWNPAEIAYYVLTQRNNKGMIGWRRDQWGATDNYITDYLKNNTRSFNGLVFKDSIMPRWKTAPITGEPPAWNPNDYADLMNQVIDYHPTSIGNGNYGITPNSNIIGRVKAASKKMGFRLAPTGGYIKTGSGSIEFSLTWVNTGYAPAYDNLNVQYELVNSSGITVRIFTSKFKPRLFTGALPVVETFSVAGLTGSFTVRLKVIDAEGYRSVMPLQLSVPARSGDGGYVIKTITL